MDACEWLLSKWRTMELSNQLPSPVLVTDSAGRVVLCNPALLALLGHAAEKWLHKTMIKMFPLPERRHIKEQVLPLLVQQESVQALNTYLLAKNGKWIPVRLNCHRELSEGQASYYWVFFVDEERARIEAELLEIRSQAQHIATELANQNQLLQVTLKSIGDAVITTDISGKVTWLNPVAERLTGWPLAEAKGQGLAQVLHIVDEVTRVTAENPFARCLRQGRTVTLAANTLLISRHGDEYGIEDSTSPIINAQGETLGIVLVFHDVTAQRRMSGELSFRATHDTLTGLVNRAEFEARLRRVFLQAKGDSSEHALLYIDLDQFKLVNDDCGHAIGDQLLQQVSILLMTAVRDRDTLARLGGDEFGVILEHCSAEQAQRIAQEICERMDNFKFIHGGRRFRIGASIGLVPIDNHWPTTDAILQAADTACYSAKDAGRNCVYVWLDSDLSVRTRHGEMQWNKRIQQALDDNQFALYAQRIEPLLPDSKGIHAAVLLRMLEADGSLIPPRAFLSAADRFSLATRVDKWVLSHTVEWLRHLPCCEKIENLSVHLSAQSVGDKAFHGWVIELLNASGAAVCTRLTFEITESVAVMNLACAGLFIEKIRALGIRVALDAFGAGASSFGYLKTLRVDYLKIDGQYIQNVVDDALDDAAVRSFIEVAKVVGAKTVAEYVDKKEVLERLRVVGVDFVQGYFLHRPEPLENLSK